MKTDAIRRKPSAWVISPQGAGGPGRSRPRRPTVARAIATNEATIREMPYGPAVLTPITASTAANSNPERSFAAEQHAVGAEARVAGERTAREELAEIGGESPDEPGEQGRVALEHVLIDRACGQQRDDDQHHGQDAAEQRGAHEDGAPALPAHPPAPRSRARSPARGAGRNPARTRRAAPRTPRAGRSGPCRALAPRPRGTRTA